MEIRSPKTGKIIRNPQRHIERLQKEVYEAWAVCRRHSRQHEECRGERIVKWDSHECSKGASSTTKLLNLKPGDIVAHIGRVVASDASRCRAGTVKSTVTYTMIETRRLPKEHWSWLIGGR